VKGKKLVAYIYASIDKLQGEMVPDAIDIGNIQKYRT
jgi:hypothetical protein